jgi:hypothetical protein
MEDSSATGSSAHEDSLFLSSCAIPVIVEGAEICL